MSTQGKTLDEKECFQRQLYCKIVWICALEKEFFAAIQVLDEIYGIGNDLPIISTADDQNISCMSRVGCLDVVLNCPSGSTGELQASKIVADLGRPSHRSVSQW